MKIFSYRYLPLNVYIGYSVFVVASLFLGPMGYRKLDLQVLIFFISIQLFLFTVGFLLGGRGRFQQGRYADDERVLPRERLGATLNILLFLGFSSSLLHLILFLSSGSDFSIARIGQSYVESYDGYERGNAAIDFIYIFNILEQALVTLVLLFSFYYFRVLGRFGKYTVIFVVATYLLVNVIGSGKQKYLGDIVVYAFFCTLIGLASSRAVFKPKTMAIASFLSVLIFLIFVEILRQRYLAAGITLENIADKAHPLITWENESIAVALIGPEYGLAVGVFLGYFTNGLYGLYLSLTLPFEWTYFVGNSYSLGRVMEIVFSSPGFVLEKTYPYRVGSTYGWGFDKWHSMFAWLASDITFPGVLMFSSIFAFWYARLWIQAVRGSNPYSGPLFLYLSLGLVFSYSNNQIMHSLSGVIVLVILFVGWVSSSSRKVKNTGSL